ncbi:hypothetical protein ACHAWX_004430, partial [Stephanocyclus meneghinianus]
FSCIFSTRISTFFLLLFFPNFFKEKTQHGIRNVRIEYLIKKHRWRHHSHSSRRRSSAGVRARG